MGLGLGLEQRLPLQRVLSGRYKLPAALAVRRPRSLREEAPPPQAGCRAAASVLGAGSDPTQVHVVMHVRSLELRLRAHLELPGLALRHGRRLTPVSAACPPSALALDRHRHVEPEVVAQPVG